MQPGSFVATQYAIPAYIHSYPDRPYNVIGYLDATTAPIRRRGVVGFAARRAKEVGSDAFIVLAEGSEYAGTLTTGYQWQLLPWWVQRRDNRNASVCSFDVW